MVEDGRQESNVSGMMDERRDVIVEVGDGKGWDAAIKIVPWKQKGKKGGRGRRGDNAARREKAREMKYGVQKIERAVSEKGEEKVVVVEMRGRSQSMAERKVKGWSGL